MISSRLGKARWSVLSSSGRTGQPPTGPSYRHINDAPLMGANSFVPCTLHALFHSQRDWHHLSALGGATVQESNSQIRRHVEWSGLYMDKIAFDCKRSLTWTSMAPPIKDALLFSKTQFWAVIMELLCLIAFIMCQQLTSLTNSNDK